MQTKLIYITKLYVFINIILIIFINIINFINNVIKQEPIKLKNKLNTNYIYK